MAIIKQQNNWNDYIDYGKQSGEYLCQSLFFDRSFILDSITLRFDSTNVDVVNDIKFRAEVRPSSGSANQLDLTDTIADYSSWYNDENIPPTEFTFPLNGLSFPAGYYYFALVSNLRVPKIMRVAFQKGGSFFGKFIHIKNSTGIYRSDYGLMIKINGTWNEIPPKLQTLDINTYVITTIQDES